MFEFPHEVYEKGAAAQTDKDPTHDIGRIVHPHIDPGIPHGSGHEEKGDGQRPIVEGKKGCLGSDVRRVTRGKRKRAATTPDKDAHRFEGLTGPRTLDPDLEQFAQRIGNDEQQQGRHHNDPSLSASPEDKTDSRQSNRDDEMVGISDDRHQDIKDGIAEVSVDDPEEKKVKAKHRRFTVQGSAPRACGSWLKFQMLRTKCRIA